MAFACILKRHSTTILRFPRARRLPRHTGPCCSTGQRRACIVLAKFLRCRLRLPICPSIIIGRGGSGLLQDHPAEMIVKRTLDIISWHNPSRELLLYTWFRTMFLCYGLDFRHAYARLANASHQLFDVRIFKVPAAVPVLKGFNRRAGVILEYFVPSFFGAWICAFGVVTGEFAANCKIVVICVVTCLSGNRDSALSFLARVHNRGPASSSLGTWSTHTIPGRLEG